MLREIIMPVLGMTQDTGVICKWYKNVGEAVGAGEILMEIETDKAVMEIEAQYSGMLKEIKFEQGIEIPVGDVVAIIESNETEADSNANQDAIPNQIQNVDDNQFDNENSKDNNSEYIGASMEALKSEEKTHKLQDNSESIDRQINLLQQHNFVQKEAGDISTSKVLASPKAKARASALSIDLNDLRNVPGISEPYHYQDIETAIQVIKSSTKEGQYSVSVEFTMKKFNNLLQWSNYILDSSITSTDLWTVFCSFAFRMNSNISSINNSISLKVSKLTKTGINCYFVKDADLGGLGTINSRKMDSGIPHQLHLFDISELNLSSFSGYSNDRSKPLIIISSADSAPVSADDHERMRLTMDFQAASFPPENAAALVNEIVSLIGQPLRLLF